MQTDWNLLREMIGAREPIPTWDDIRKMVQWFGNHAAPSIKWAIADHRRATLRVD